MLDRQTRPAGITTLFHVSLDACHTIAYIYTTCHQHALMCPSNCNTKVLCCAEDSHRSLPRSVRCQQLTPSTRRQSLTEKGPWGAPPSASRSQAEPIILRNHKRCCWFRSLTFKRRCSASFWKLPALTKSNPAFCLLFSRLKLLSVRFGSKKLQTRWVNHAETQRLLFIHSAVH
jgi:hypothetical protein